MRLHLIPELGHIRLVRLQPQDVRDFLDERLDRGLSPRTVKHLRATLRAALNQAVNDELLQRNVAQKVKAPEVVSAALDVYTPEEARILLEAAKSHRLEALFTVAAGLALRKGECLGLQWSDINFARGLVTIRHSLQRIKRVRRGDVVREGEAKTERLPGQPKGKKIHSLRLPGVVLEALDRHRMTQREERLLAGTCWRGKGQYVFTSMAGTPLEARRLDRIFHEITREAGLLPLRFHDLRHSTAAILIAQGVHPKAFRSFSGTPRSSSPWTRTVTSSNRFKEKRRTKWMPFCAPVPGKKMAQLMSNQYRYGSIRLVSDWFYGAPGQIRTADLLVRSQTPGCPVSEFSAALRTFVLIPRVYLAVKWHPKWHLSLSSTSSRRAALAIIRQAEYDAEQRTRGGRDFIVNYLAKEPTVAPRPAQPWRLPANMSRAESGLHALPEP